MEITKGDIINDARTEVGSQQGATPPVAAVYSVNRKFSNIAKSDSRTSSGATTLYTTPTDRDFYLTTANLAYTKNALSDMTQIYLEIYVDDKSVYLIRLVAQTLTAGSDKIALFFPHPIKLSRGSTIVIGGTFTAGASKIGGAITGFLL